MDEHKKDWMEDIEQMEQYFKSIDLNQTVQLEPFATITNLKKFIECHLSIVKAQNGKRTFLPYMERLNKVKELLKI